MFAVTYKSDCRRLVGEQRRAASGGKKDASERICLKLQRWTDADGRKEGKMEAEEEEAARQAASDAVFAKRQRDQRQ